MSNLTGNNISGTLQVGIVKGKSAYEIAVENGFEGTEAEWLATLQGDGTPVLLYADTGYNTDGAMTQAATTRALDMKVDKVSGKRLTTNDYTTEEKNKLAGIEANANNYSLPTASTEELGGVKVGENLSVSEDGTLSADIPQFTMPTASADNLGAVKVGTNLSVDEDGVLSADIPEVETVNPDWTETDETAANFIQNKPPIQNGDYLYYGNKQVTIQEGKHGVAYLDGAHAFDGRGSGGGYFTGKAGSLDYVVSSGSVMRFADINDYAHCLFVAFRGKEYRVDEIETEVSPYNSDEYILTTVRLYETLDSENDIERAWVTIYIGNIAYSQCSFAHGSNVCAYGYASHAEGGECRANDRYSHAEGEGTIAKKQGSHSEGYRTNANGRHSHAEGNQTTASGDYSHTEGVSTLASGYNSHAEGEGTIANCSNCHVEGRYNAIVDTDDYAHIVGNGNHTEDRSNAYTLDWKGNGVYSGKLTVGAGPTDDMDVATKGYVDNAVSGFLTAEQVNALIAAALEEYKKNNS